MSIRIQTYHRGHLEGMLNVYDTQTADERFIAPLTPEMFIGLVEKKSYFDPEGLFVAAEGDTVVGWVHACVAGGTERWHDASRLVPQIRMLLFPRHRLDVGIALVSEATRWMAQTGQPEHLAIHCKHGYPFYRGLWMGGEPMVPTRMTHIHTALSVGGFQPTAECVFQTAELNGLPTKVKAKTALEFVTAPVDMMNTFMEESWAGFEPCVTKAFVGEEQAGQIGWLMISGLSEKLGAPAVNIWMMGVSEAHRRKGIGTALVCEALTEGYRRGARFATVDTQTYNIAALSTYRKFGFLPQRIIVGRTRQTP